MAWDRTKDYVKGNFVQKAKVKACPLEGAVHTGPCTRWGVGHHHCLAAGSAGAAQPGYLPAAHRGVPGSLWPCCCTPTSSGPTRSYGSTVSPPHAAVTMPRACQGARALMRSCGVQLPCPDAHRCWLPLTHRPALQMGASTSGTGESLPLLR